MNRFIILFDGVCNFCNFWINLILKKDIEKKFLFSSLQSETGQKYLKKFGFNLSVFDTFIVIEGERYFIKSDAVLLIAANLPYPYKILGIFRPAPKFLRDWLYSLVARNRYAFFGKRKACRTPLPEEKERFLS